MPWRLWRKYPGDPNKRRAFIIVTMLGMAGLAGLLWITVATVNRNKREIGKRPTAEEVLSVLLKRAEADRRACRVTEKKFAAIYAVIQGQRPSAARTEYYRTHPRELEEARRQFDRILRAFKPRNCLMAYPVPTLAKVKRDLAKKGETSSRTAGGGDVVSGGGNPNRPP